MTECFGTVNTLTFFHVYEQCMFVQCVYLVLKFRHCFIQLQNVQGSKEEQGSERGGQWWCWWGKTERPALASSEQDICCVSKLSRLSELALLCQSCVCGCEVLQSGTSFSHVSQCPSKRRLWSPLSWMAQMGLCVCV